MRPVKRYGCKSIPHFSNHQGAYLSEEITASGGIEPVELPAVLERMFLLHGDKWLAFAMRVVRSHEDAEDVLQDSALRMLTRGRCFGSADEARMYLSRVVTNTAIASYHRRRRRRLRDCPLFDESLPVSVRSESVIPVAGTTEFQETGIFLLLQEGLQKLPPKQCDALRLTYLQPSDVSLRKAGTVNAIPYSTLRHRRMKGLRRLKKFLRKALRNH